MYLENADRKFSDEELFKQPPPKEDCPICFVLLPTLYTGWRYKPCCGKVICSGCIYAPLYDNQGNKVDNKKCPFCRVPTPYTNEEAMEREKKREEKDDPLAIGKQGMYYEQGRNGFPKDYTKALELYHRAANLGYANAYSSIGYAYSNGQGVKVNKKRASHYFELSAMMGNETARHNLGSMEARTGNTDRALKHYMIAASAGDNDSLIQIQDLYSNGHATKDDYMKALQTYQTYLSEIKSSQRDEAAAFDNERYRYY